MGQSKSPVTVALYGLLYELPFRPLAIAQVTNAVLGAAQAVCIYAIARRAFASTVAGRFAGMVFALTPSAVMYSVLPASEPFFFTLLLVLMWLCMRLAGAATTMPMRGAVTTAALAGAAAALLHLTRNAGIAYALWAAVAAMLWARAGAVRTAVVGGTFLATMLLCLFPQAVYNYKTYGAISLQSSKYAGLNFLSGTNRESSGQHNPRDVAFVRNQFGDEHWNEAMKAARSRALRRIREDVPGFFAFALTEKFDVMWCEDTYAAMTHPVCMWRGKLLPWRSMSQGFYVALVALGAAGACLAFARGTGGLAIVTAGGILAMTFLLHVFIEVQPRYHAVLVYLLPIFASALVAGKETPQDD
jgi:hypothetical protein